MNLALKALMIVVLLAVKSSSTLIYVPNLIPVDPNLLKNLQAACDVLESTLDETYGTPKQNNIKIYKQLKFLQYLLQKLENDPGISCYNNVIAGSRNMVNGVKNYVLGSDNAFTGTRNFVFTSGFTPDVDTLNNNLVLDKYQIELLKIYLVWIRAQLAVHLRT